MSFGQLTHNLILTRFLVAAKMWAESRPDFKLLQVRTCYEVGSDYPSVEMVKEGKKESVKVIPDAWLLFERVRKEKVCSFPFLLEIDRGTAYRNKFKEHIASRIEFIKRGGVYSKLLGEKL